MSGGLGDKVKGKAEEVSGKIQEKVGHATGNEELEAKGEAKQVKGKLHEAKGTVEDKLTDVKRKAEKTTEGATVSDTPPDDALYA